MIRLAISLWQTQSDSANHDSHRSGEKDRFAEKEGNKAKKNVKKERETDWKNSGRKDDKEQSAQGIVKRYEKVNRSSVLS